MPAVPPRKAKTLARARSAHPYVILRPQPDGSLRPRFQPTSRERAIGFENRDLKHPDARWYNYEEACAFARGILGDIVAARNSGKYAKLARAPGTTIEHLLKDWLASDEVAALAPASIDSYGKMADAVLYLPESRAEAKARRERTKAAKLLDVAPPERAREPFSLKDVAAIGRPELRAFFNYARRVRGLNMANHMIAAISAALTWGQEDTRWRLEANPRIGMSFEDAPGRVMLIPLDEFRQIVAAADLLGRPSIGDCWYLGLFGGRRQTDRLLIADEGLVDGRRKLVQSKTGLLIPCKDAPQLAARLDAARARVAALKLKFGRRELPGTIVVDETTCEPYVDTTYRHWVAECRRAAVHGLVRFPDGTLVIADPNARGREAGWLERSHNMLTWVLQPMPSCANKRDQDLRDTCVILLERALRFDPRQIGDVILAICDVTGHSYKSVQTVIKHYLGSNDRARSDAAIDRLASFVGLQDQKI